MTLGAKLTPCLLKAGLSDIFTLALIIIQNVNTFIELQLLNQAKS